jgi:hypothetical protein
MARPIEPNCWNRNRIWANSLGVDNSDVPSRSRFLRVTLEARVRSRGSVVTLIVLLLVCVGALTVMGVWATRRRRELVSWHLELDAAFDNDERRELPRGRTL